MAGSDDIEHWNAPYCDKCHKFHWHKGVNFDDTYASGNACDLIPLSKETLCSNAQSVKTNTTKATTVEPAG